MSKKLLYTFLRSFGTACVVAFVLALAITGKWFSPLWFFAILVGQFVLFEFVGMIIDRFAVSKALNREIAQQTKMIEEAITKQSLSLNCAYCNTVNRDIPIVLREENIFKCIQCNQENIIFMQFYAARRTKPVEVLENPKAEHAT